MNKELVQFIFCGQREWIVMENNHPEDKIGRTFLTLTTVVFFFFLEGGICHLREKKQEQ